MTIHRAGVSDPPDPDSHLTLCPAWFDRRSRGPGPTNGIQPQPHDSMARNLKARTRPVADDRGE
jgi:hypothetical protein